MQCSACSSGLLDLLDIHFLGQELLLIRPGLGRAACVDSVVEVADRATASELDLIERDAVNHVRARPVVAAAAPSMPLTELNFDTIRKLHLPRRPRGRPASDSSSSLCFEKSWSLRRSINGGCDRVTCPHSTYFGRLI